MISIAVIGSKGYVGSALYKELLDSSKYSVVGVTKENYLATQAQEFDIIINCAMPSGRFWANNHPEEDFIETVKKTDEMKTAYFRILSFFAIFTVLSVISYIIFFAWGFVW